MPKAQREKTRYSSVKEQLTLLGKHTCGNDKACKVLRAAKNTLHKLEQASEREKRVQHANVKKEHCGARSRCLIVARL